MSSLQVKPWVAEPPAKPVSHYITRMNEQRGSFRELTEQELEDEIARGKDDKADDVSSDEENEDPVEKRREELKTAKEKIMMGLLAAHYEVSCNRDFVSLLLTGDPERPNSHVTLDLRVKDRVPLGSLDKQFIRPPLVNAQQADEVEKVAADTLYERRLAAGIKLRGLNSSADTILAAAQRLEEEMTREARYWQDVISIKERGWPITRSSGRRREIGVRLNTLESAPDFRARGFIRIGRTDEGRAELDLSDDLAEGKRLRVEIRSQGRIVAAADEEAISDGSLHDSLKQARDTLFDQELFYELSRESAALWHMGVKWTDQGALMPFDGSTEIAVSLVAPGDVIDVPMSDDDPSTELYRQVANAIAPALRILLSHGFRRIYNKRSAPPQAITSRKPTQSVHSILQPLLHRAKHQAIQQQMNEFMNDLAGILKRSCFDAELDRPRDDMGLKAALESMDNSGRPAVEVIVNKLSNPTPSTYVLRLAKSETTIKIMFRINNTGPEFRYEISEMPSESLLTTIPKDLVVPDQSEFQNAILHLVQLRIVELIHQRLDQTKWLLASPHTGEIKSKPPPAMHGQSPMVRLIRIVLLRDSLAITLRKPISGGGSSEHSRSIKATDTENVDIRAELVKIT